jgi:asparagine synthase (glutamine-hydrolysing)
VLSAYKKWGSDCAEHLLGDFTFAIWDAGAR